MVEMSALLCSTVNGICWVRFKNKRHKRKKRLAGIFVFQEFPRPGTRSSMNAVLLLTLISLSQSGNGTKTINGSLKLQRHKIWKEKDNQLGEWCFNYRLRRRTLYYLTNLILPCILIASMVFLKGVFFC